MADEDRREHSRYSLFGLQIDSELPLPELFAGNVELPSDIIIERGEVPAGGDLGPGLHAVEGGTLLVVDQAANYLVSGGSRILVDAHSGASERNVRLFLLGSVFGLIIHQRGLLPLHANAVQIDGRIVAFMGSPGVGKSTLAAWFSDRGYPLIADDVTVIDLSEGTPLVQPGLPRLRLWEKVITATGRDPNHFQRSFEGEPAYDKRDVLLPMTKVVTEPLELGAMVELTRSGNPFEPLQGATAVEAIYSHTYRGHYVQPLETSEDHWSQCVRLARAVHAYRATVNFDLDRLDESYEPLLESVRRALGDS